MFLYLYVPISVSQSKAFPMHKNPDSKNIPQAGPLSLRRSGECISVGGWKEGQEDEGASCSVTSGLEAIGFSLARQWVSEWA